MYFRVVSGLLDVPGGAPDLAGDDLVLPEAGPDSQKRFRVVSGLLDVPGGVLDLVGPVLDLRHLPEAGPDLVGAVPGREAPDFRRFRRRRPCTSCLSTES